MLMVLLRFSVTILETTVRDVIKNEATGQVLGVICKKKGAETEEHVSSCPSPTCTHHNTNY